MIHASILEYFAYWEGNLSAGRLARAIGRSRVQTQRSVINRYRDDHPGRLVKKSGRWSLPAEGGEDLLVYAPHTPSDLLDTIVAEKITAEASGVMPRFGVPVEDVTFSGASNPPCDFFRAIYEACANDRCVFVTYLARSGVSSFIFSPHALVRAHARCHFRGHARWLETGRDEFIDLVPSRVVRVENVDYERTGPREDHPWNDKVDLTFDLNPELPQNVLDQVMVEHGGLQGGDPGKVRLRIAGVRRALALYAARSTEYRWFGNKLLRVWVPQDLPEHQAESKDDG